MIRLQRIGRKNQAAFRLLVLDSHRGPKAGKNVELLGSYNPHSNLFQVEKDRILYWMSKGAQISDTVRNLLISNKIIEGKKINVLPRKAPIKGESAPEPVATPVAAVAEPEVVAESSADVVEEVAAAPEVEVAVDAAEKEEAAA